MRNKITDVRPANKDWLKSWEEIKNSARNGPVTTTKPPANKGISWNVSVTTTKPTTKKKLP